MRTSVRVLLGWHLAILLLLLVLPVVLLGHTPWSLPRLERTPFVALLAAYVASSLLQWPILRLPSDRNRFVLTILLTAAVFGLVFLLLLLTQRAGSRKLLLGVFALALVLLPIPMLTRRFRTIALACVAAGLLLLGGFALSQGGRDRERRAPQTTESYVSTTFYNLRILSHAGKVPHSAVRGGGLAAIEAAASRPSGQIPRVLLGTGDGRLYLIEPAAGAPAVQPVQQRVPLNGEEFAAEFGLSYGESDQTAEYGENAGAGVQTWRFRVADILAQPLPGRIRIFASHHYWKHEEACFVLRVSSLEAAPAGLPATIERGTWRTAFESTPCLPLMGKSGKRGANPFQGEEIGGRMALLDEHTLLLTVGDMGFAGLDSDQILAQDPAASYGKTVRIDLRTGVSEVFTLGHRNPQGLHVAADGTIWSTEHAARGGDELNVLRAGANYGWPRVTFGVDYDTYYWPLSERQGHHDRYVEPVYAWLPSIGVSNLTAITRSTAFPVWRGDLLAGSLVAKSLYRIRVRGESVVFIESIPLQQRVRDLLELEDGRLLIWTDGARLLEIAPARGTTAAALFGARCSGCHRNLDGTWHRLGPDLHGVTDRGIAEAQGFSYSPALKRIRGNWTREKLDAFLANPQAFAPGTTMASTGIEDPRERRLIIDHLLDSTK